MKASTIAGPFTLPPLPWKEGALAPILSPETMSFHHGKHHQGYVDNLNRLVAASPLAELPLEQLVKETARAPGQTAVYNNAAQAWNHAFFWQSLSPCGGVPMGTLRAKIDEDLGGYAGFKEQLSGAAMGQFGSGWAWLVLDEGTLRVTRTANADTPLTEGKTCLLTIDVWEHAYYLDYRNRRAAYVAAVIEKLLNWEFAAEQLARAESELLVR